MMRSSERARFPFLSLVAEVDGGVHDIALHIDNTTSQDSLSVRTSFTSPAILTTHE